MGFGRLKFIIPHNEDISKGKIRIIYALMNIFAINQVVFLASYNFTFTFHPASRLHLTFTFIICLLCHVVTNYQKGYIIRKMGYHPFTFSFWNLMINMNI